MLNSFYIVQKIILRKKCWQRLGAAAVLLCLGCGEVQPIALVSGTITFEGKPLVGASITTQPIASSDSGNVGTGSFGKTDEQGRFELELVKPAKKGAIIAEHRVMISRASGGQTEGKTEKSADDEIETWTDDPNAGRNVDRSWPKQFTDGSLRLTVPPEGKTAANFNLKR